MQRKEEVFSSAQKLRVEVVSNTHLKANFYRLTIKTPAYFSKAQPGQFIHIKVGDDFSPLLRRPFSISNVTSFGVDIVYRIVGKGTRFLSELREGEYLDVLGPLGRGFSISREAKIHILVGGGVGVAPLIFLARKIKEETEGKVSILVFLGFKRKEEIICQNQFTGDNLSLHIACEDGSYGYRGLVSQAVEDYLINFTSLSGISIYACGPVEMLRAVARLSFNYAISSQVLMEEIIGCGLGACRGCVVRGVAGYLRVCKEGPVFNIRDIAWS